MANVNVLVRGGRGSGKTSLAAMLDMQLVREQEVCKGLAFRRKEGEEQPGKYAFALTQMKSCFQHSSAELLTTDSLMPAEWTRTSYLPTLNQKPLGFTLNLTDSSGQFDHVDQINQIYDQVCSSQIILITVDTPRLMDELEHVFEDDPEYSRYNRIREITMIVKKALMTHRDRRLVMFVPLKCEKYYNENRMKEVNRAVKDGYNELFEFLDEEGISNCTAPAIVPVMTLGGAEFSCFDESGRACYQKTGKGYNPVYAEHILLLCQQQLLCQAQYYKKNPKEAKARFGTALNCRVGADGLMNAKETIGKFLDRHDSVAFEILRDPIELNIRRRLADFNILMFGSRRAGKSSVLASMIASFDQLGLELAHRISLKPTDQTQLLLENKRDELQTVFRKGKDDPVRWSVDENPTDNPYEYEFQMSIQESPKSYTINFMDIPGEWLKEPEKEKRLVKELNQCQIIIIAIDTPHLMEENGRFHDAFNIPKDISRMIKAIRNQKLQRMFLLVPIKCEKYYHEGRMDEVREAVKKGYASLLNELEKRNKKRRNELKHTVAITPIFTMGGVVFDSFGRNQQGIIDIFNQGISIRSLRFRPKVAFYKLYEKAPRFAPKFCEQPMVYLLCFILRTAKLAGKRTQRSCRMYSVPSCALFRRSSGIPER